MTLPTDAKARKAMAIFTFLTEYFPDAIEELVAISVAGNEQHNPGQPLHWARGKSTDQLDTALRHMWDHKLVGPRDIDGRLHIVKAAWRNLAEGQLTIEAEKAAAKSAEKADPDITVLLCTSTKRSPSGGRATVPLSKVDHICSVCGGAVLTGGE